MSKTTAAKLIIHQRTDWEQTLTPPVLPLPDASWGARCQIRDAVGVLLAEPLATVEPDGDIRLELGRSLTNIRPSSSHAYDVLLESPGGDRDKFFSGQVTVVGTITQWGVVPPVIPGAPPDPIPAWLSGVVDGAIANHNANLAAHPGLAFELVAGVALSGDRAVIADSAGQAIYADGANPSHIGRVIGITVTSAASGANVAIAPSGELTETSWNWTPGAVFVGANGVLTQAPPASGFTQAIAVVITPTRIRVQILSPTLRQ